MFILSIIVREEKTKKYLINRKLYLRDNCWPTFKHVAEIYSLFFKKYLINRKTYLPLCDKPLKTLTPEDAFLFDCA